MDPNPFSFYWLKLLSFFGMRAGIRDDFHDAAPFDEGGTAYCKISLAGLIGFLVMPVAYGSPLDVQGFNLDYALLVVGEALLGVLTGFFISIIFASFSTAGQFFSYQMGFGVSEVYDALAQIENPLMGQFLNFIAVLIFLQIKGFQTLFLGGVLRSFQSINCFMFLQKRELISSFLVTNLSSLFLNAMMIAMPVMGTLFLVHVSMGLLSKAAPQMNLLSEGFPITILLTFFLLTVSLPFMANFFVRIMENGFAAFESLLIRAGGVSSMRKLAIEAASGYSERNFFIDLQWFAAEDEGRTEDPTDYKIRKAREEGRVAKSQDINAALVLLFPAGALIFLSSFFWKNVWKFSASFFAEHTGGYPKRYVVRYLCAIFLKLALPLALIAMIAGVIANVLQNNGFLFSTKPIQPQFNKIVPDFIRFFKRALFSTEGLFNFAKSLTKVVVLVFVAFLMIRANLPHFIELLTVSFPQAIFFIAGVAAKLLATAALLLLILAIPDYFFQRKQFIDSLKMTKQEIKEEYKELEGDPQVKGRIRQQMQAILSQNAIRNVPKADVVITNPTHFAIAMQWDSKNDGGADGTGKGADAMAQKIKAIAREYNIPLIENKPLARALYAKVQIGDIIPEEYYRALSLVFAEVYTLNNKKQEFYRR